MFKKDYAQHIFASVSLGIILVLGFLLMKKERNQSCSPYIGSKFATLKNYNPQHEMCTTKCLCAGSGKVCADSCKLKSSYLEGNTEFQNFAGIQKGAGGPFWKSTDFGKY